MIPMVEPASALVADWVRLTPPTTPDQAETPLKHRWNAGCTRARARRREPAADLPLGLLALELHSGEVRWPSK